MDKQTKKTVKKVASELKQVEKKLSQAINWTKDKYEHLDDNTKKKIITGIVSTTALIAGALSVKKMFKKKKK